MVKDYFAWLIPINKDLRRFLKVRHLLVSFHLNLFLYSKSFCDYNNTRYELKKIDENSIFNSLTWDCTMEGYSYWEHIDCKWRIYYKFLNMKINDL